MHDLWRHCALRFSYGRTICQMLSLNKSRMVVFSVLKSSEYSFYCFWIPFSWASCLVQEAKKAGRITDVLFCIELQREIDKAGIDK